LSVRRGDKRFNIYQVSSDFIAIGKNNQPVKNMEQSDPIGQIEGADRSSGLDLNKKEQDINKNPRKKDLVDGFLELNLSKEARDANEVEELLNTLERGLRRNINRTLEWQLLAKWIIKQGNLQNWIDWYMSDPFQAKNSWRLTPSQIRASYPQAPKPESINRVITKDPELYKEYKPLPSREEWEKMKNDPKHRE
jgi:hypothetical protein